MKYSEAIISYVRIMKERLAKAIKENDTTMMLHIVDCLELMQEKMESDNNGA